MRVGLLGLPASGKTTLFQLLTRHAPATTVHGATLAAGRVPDGRLDKLAEIHRPRRTVYTQIEFVDLPSWIPEGGGPRRNGALLQHIRDVDLLVHVVRAFDDPTVPTVHGTVDPLRDAQAVHEELLLADWSLVETRLNNLAQARKKQPDHDKQVALLERFRACLEGGAPLSSLSLTEDEEALMRGDAFISRKPIVVALNVSEDALGEADDPQRQAVEAWCRQQGIPLIVTSARVEAEIEALSGDEREGFLAAYGLEASGLERLARTAYEHLGLIAFFTAGEKEVRAWTVRRGVRAPQAARAIHSDIERGFIRAEVADHKDLLREGSLTALKEKGLLRIEGKDYLVQDGEVIHFRFNV